MKVVAFAWNYIKNNKHHTAVLCISISLFLTLLYCMGFILSGTYDTFHNVCVDLSDRMVYISSNEYDSSSSPAQLEAAAEKLRQDPHVEDAMVIGTMTVRVTPAIGEYNFSCPLTTAENIKKIMKHMNATLIEGDFPANDGDIIIDEKLCANRGYQLGDEVKPGYHITGILKSDYYLCMGINFEVYENNILLLSNQKNYDYTALTHDLSFPHSLKDGVTGRKSYKVDIVNSIDPSTKLITFCTLILLSICLVVVINMYIKDRHEEWCLYASIGYSTRFIYLLALWELLLTFLLSIGIAFLLILLGMYTINQLVFAGYGLLCSYFLPDSLLSMLGSLLFILGICQLPIAHSLHAVQTIDCLESDN
ncbi:FtsX-like permease family protein [Anaerosporobacter faecicola]|uniref:FtsX-like permease family protein n=1 Tax=Anaerosporobacter faecicola TaxID=2718714 RepID=UPI00143B0462|nr:FtsX-like permease family protein [Anaerosporobacter faecicola]